MVPAPRVVVLRKASGERGADQVEAPDRILRLSAMLDMVNNELQLAAIPPASVPPLQRVLEGSSVALERSVSPAPAHEAVSLPALWSAARVTGPARASPGHERRPGGS